METAKSIAELYIHPDEEHDSVSYINYWTKIDQRLKDEYRDKYKIKSDNIAEECVTCQITHIDKYKALYPNSPKESIVQYRTSGGKASLTHAWQISCPYIPLDYLSGVNKALLASMSSEEREIIKATLDPVAFGRRNFGWQARKHQEIMMRCQAKKKVLRCGRRTGKSEAMAMEILFHALTREKVIINPDTGQEITSPIKVLIIAPYLAQVKEIFLKIKGFLEKNKELKETMIRDVQTPNYELKFTNGSTIVGFTTGSKNTGDASTIRGQGADVIYIDEADYLGAGDFKALIPVFTDNPDIVVRASSTPSGKDLRFKEWCSDSPGWKEFYFPTPVLERTLGINWKRMRREQRSEFSFDEWQQEMMALFIAGSNSVYQSRFVSEAMEDYTYEDMSELQAQGRLIGWDFSVGVDWNKDVGTEICVIGYTKSAGRHMFKVFDYYNVPKQDFTQHAGLSEVIRMCRKWQAKYVYIDRGYGAVQWEMIRLWSLQQRPGTYERSLERRVKAFEFGGNIEIRDPATGKKVSHPGKAYMIEASVRKFEDGVIKFSKDDDKLRKQLLNYIIKGRDRSNRPLYGVESPKIGDHYLDAFNLAIVAFVIEEGVLSKGYYSGAASVEMAGTEMQQEAAVNAIRKNPSMAFFPTIEEEVKGPNGIRLMAEARNSNVASRNNNLEGNSKDEMFPVYDKGYKTGSEGKYSSKTSAVSRGGSKSLIFNRNGRI
jgi:replicative DNA helicase